MKFIELPPISDSPEEAEFLEREIDRVFRNEIYLPMVRELNQTDKVLNSLNSLNEAIMSGRIYFNRGRFKGRFSASISRTLRKLGATWDRKEQCYKILSNKLPIDIKRTISLSDFNFRAKTQKIMDFINQLNPEKIAGKVKSESIFDTMLFRVEKNFKKNIKNITIAPDLTMERLKRISQEYTNNLQLYIQDWTQKEIVELRKDMQQKVFSGARYEDMIDHIQYSYGVSKTKAKFLARQESKLLIVKYTQSRYQDSGVNEYKWRCVAGSPNHPVRHMHKIHDGKIFTWDNPPIINEKGDKKNPGQDYNCRCKAIPIVRFG